MHSIHYMQSDKDKYLLDLFDIKLIELKKISTNMNDIFLFYEEDFLTLWCDELSLKLSVDFFHKNIYKRIQSNKKLPLIKAIEGKHRKYLTILDMTAGLGQDTFLLASRGHKIYAIEKNPYMFLLLKDGLRRAKNKKELSKITENIMTDFNDSTESCGKFSSNTYDVIYLDPMFPKRKKKAKVKKNMQILNKLIGIEDECNVHFLLEYAKRLKPKKIVIKRPKLSNFVNSEKPTNQVIGKRNRFDIYT